MLGAREVGLSKGKTEAPETGGAGGGTATGGDTQGTSASTPGTAS
jgi:hypothetical protein